MDSGEMNSDEMKTSSDFTEAAIVNLGAYGETTPQATFIRGIGYAILALAAAIREASESRPASAPSKEPEHPM